MEIRFAGTGGASWLARRGLPVRLLHARQDQQ